MIHTDGKPTIANAPRIPVENLPREELEELAEMTIGLSSSVKTWEITHPMTTPVQYQAYSHEKPGPETDASVALALILDALRDRADISSIVLALTDEGVTVGTLFGQVDES